GLLLPVMIERGKLAVAEQDGKLVAGCEVRRCQGGEGDDVEGAVLAGLRDQAAGAVEEHGRAYVRLAQVGGEEIVETLVLLLSEEADAVAQPANPAGDPPAARVRARRAGMWVARRRSSGRGAQATKARSSCPSSTDAFAPAMWLSAAKRRSARGLN